MSRKNNLRVTLYVDGAARGNPGPAAIGVVMIGPAGRIVKEIGESLGEATNNVAESMALIVGLQEALALGFRSISVLTDSELLAKQVNGDYRVKDQTLRWLHLLIRRLREHFSHFEIAHIPREKNKRADRLAAKAVGPVQSTFF